MGGFDSSCQDLESHYKILTFKNLKIFLLNGNKDSTHLYPFAIGRLCPLFLIENIQISDVHMRG